mgnify:CR=1 FL=1
MTKGRTVLAATFALTVLGGGIAASGVAQAQHSPSGTVPRTSTTEKPTPNTLQSVCLNGQSGVAGGQCTTYSTVATRTKNAALPVTTATLTMPRPTTTTTTIKPRVKNGIPRATVTPATTCPVGGTCTNPRK